MGQQRGCAKIDRGAATGRDDGDGDGLLVVAAFAVGDRCGDDMGADAQCGGDDRCTAAKGPVQTRLPNNLAAEITGFRIARDGLEGHGVTRHELGAIGGPDHAQHRRQVVWGYSQNKGALVARAGCVRDLEADCGTAGRSWQA